MNTTTQSMHKLIRISLINWYLFGAEDIAINGDIILFRGGNGAGKSSLLDAMQTVLAGADETELLMNAASSDGKRSARNIRSYVLGVVNESNGQSVCEPRKESNTYICLTFQKKDSSFFSVGIALHARTSDQKLSKYRFIVKGDELSSLDFMESDNVVMPWKKFERRIQAMECETLYPPTAMEFRLKVAELMSASGPNYQISPQMMLRTIKKGIGFREQKCISEFTKEHILPENSIDVINIQNDYNQYKEIQSLIEEAKNRTEVLSKIEKTYNIHLNKLRSSTSHRWTSCESLFTLSDNDVQNNIEETEARELETKTIDSSIQELKISLPILQKCRDTAFNQHTNSDYFLARKENESAIQTCEFIITDSARQIRSTKSQIYKLITNTIPYALSENLKNDFIKVQRSLSTISLVENTDLISKWPENGEHIQKMQQELIKYAVIVDQIQSDRDMLYQEIEQVTDLRDNISTALEHLLNGKAKLHASTEKVIDLLSDANIEAIPVCELAEVSDAEWQIGIERFLGGNREALVVQSESYTKALSIYRREKDLNTELRSVKLVNPDKGFGFDGSPTINTAAALIKSDNPIASRFLRGLLHNVNLVTTEEELRRERRAITKDGMVAGNGAISGGNRFNWVLIGVDARKIHAKKLQQQLSEFDTQLRELHKAYKPVDEINKSIRSKVSTGIDSLEKLPQATTILDIENEKLKTLKASLEEMESAPDLTLKTAFEKADKALDDTRIERDSLSKKLRIAQYDIDKLIEKLPTLKKQLLAVTEERVSCEKSAYFDLSHAQQTYDNTENKFGPDEYIKICEYSDDSRKSADKSAQEAQEKGIRLTTEYVTEYQPEDRLEFVEMPPTQRVERCRMHIERIEQSEMLAYEEDAREAREKMLSNFRSEVIAKLNENFTQLERTFSSLNNQLESLIFNNNKYRFTFPKVESSTLKAVYEYIKESTDIDRDMVGTMFDDNRENPTVKLIENVLVNGQLSDIADYRNFYTYDIVATDQLTEIPRHFSQLLAHGSGGEKQTPFYVALGASFMSAYKIRKVGNSVFGGAAIAIFDEAFSKMDGNNTQAALKFFRDIGLQVILAAPPESEVKVGPYADCVYNVLRAGSQVYIDHKVYTDQGKNLLESDDPKLHPEILAPYIKKVQEELTDD